MAYGNNPARARALEKYIAHKKAIVDALRCKPCTDCSQIFPFYVMEFDHVPTRGPKLFTIGVGVKCKTLPALMDGLAKCDIVCANCHKIRTYNRDGSYGN